MTTVQGDCCDRFVRIVFRKYFIVAVRVSKTYFVHIAENVLHFFFIHYYYTYRLKWIVSV